MKYLQMRLILNLDNLNSYYIFIKIIKKYKFNNFSKKYSLKKASFNKITAPKAVRNAKQRIRFMIVP
jgi:hypothetical protein